MRVKDELKVFDWIEVAIERIEQVIDRLKATATSTYKALKTKLGATADEISVVNQELALQQQAYNRYMQEANSVGLSTSLAERVRNGAIDIREYDSETQKLIEDYQNWYEKALACKDSIDELHEALTSLYEDNFNNIQKDYDNQLELLEHTLNLFEADADLREAQGYLGDASIYKSLEKAESERISLLNKELAALEKTFAEAMSSNKIEKYSESWYSMQSAINSVKDEIDDANISLIEYGKTAREIAWEAFDYSRERISQLTSEADFLIDLMSADKLLNDNGSLTDIGNATVGLHANNFGVYMEQALKYAEEMQSIEKELSKNPYDTELIERREELLELQQESILAAENEKQAIADLVQEGIDLELESLQNLIDAYTDALDSAKSLYDYQMKIADHTSQISSLQKQLLAYENDDSEETQAKVQQLRVDLEKAQADLEETEYDQYIDDQKKLLDDLYSEYKIVLNERLDNIDTLISDMIESAQLNTKSIISTITQVGSEVGYSITQALSKDLTDRAVEAGAYVMGDLNNSGSVTVSDLLKMQELIANGGVTQSDLDAGDINGDGRLTISDLLAVKNSILTGQPILGDSSLAEAINKLKNQGISLISSNGYSVDNVLNTVRTTFLKGIIGLIVLIVSLTNTVSLLKKLVKNWIGTMQILYLFSLIIRKMSLLHLPQR